MKDAYLILAHRDFELLKSLVSCLDDERNDIFLHVDAKVALTPKISANRANPEVLSERVDVRWGDRSMIEAEYALFEAAAKKGPYRYYHLLSGADLPLKSQDYIHDFFEKNAGKEFIGYSQISPEELSRRMQLWHLFPKHFSRKRNFYSIIRAAFLRTQLALGIRRNKEIEFKKGSQWVSVTEDFVQYLLEKREWAMRTFSHTFVPDECLMQTLCWNSPFRERIYSLASDGEGCMRAIGWKDGELRDWGEEDLEVLKESKALFGRKFSSEDKAFIEKILRFAQNDKRDSE